MKNPSQEVTCNIKVQRIHKLTKENNSRKEIKSRM